MVFGMTHFPLKECIDTLEKYVKPTPTSFDKVRHLAGEEYKRVMACLPEEQPAITAMTTNIKTLSTISAEKRSQLLVSYCNTLESIVKMREQIGRPDISTK
ncbi:MAG: hypothetical protein LLF94_03660 [Chlamydiales bacterium]|nr:hypothetical protein [Chlamydiales bacterium]